MTGSVTRSIEIDAPAEEVFAYVSDPRRQTRAMARALERRVVVNDVETSPKGVVTGGALGSCLASATPPR